MSIRCEELNIPAAIGTGDENFEKLKFNYFFLQPMDGLNLKKNIKKTHAYCSRNKKWKVSLQLHKIAGMP